MELLNTANGGVATQACGSECHEQSDGGPGDFELAFLNGELSAMRDAYNRITLMDGHARLWSSWRSRSRYDDADSPQLGLDLR